MFSSSLSSSSWKLSDAAAGLLLALGTALNAVKGGDAGSAVPRGGSLSDGGGRRLNAVKGGDADSAAPRGGSLWDGDGRRLTTCRRDPELGLFNSMFKINCT